MKRQTNSTVQGCGLRSGVTLSEVLVALMIMSIGLTLVASMFPVAALRTLQATQMTNSVILKNNAESLITMIPELVFNPNGAPNANVHFQNPTLRNYVVDPLGFYTHVSDGNPAIGANFGTRPAATPSGWEPHPGFPVPRYGGDLHTPVGIGLGTSDPAEQRALSLLASTLAELGDGWTTQYDGIPRDCVQMLRG